MEGKYGNRAEAPMHPAGMRPIRSMFYPRRGERQATRISK